MGQIPLGGTAANSRRLCGAASRGDVVWSWPCHPARARPLGWTSAGGPPVPRATTGTGSRGKLRLCRSIVKREPHDLLGGLPVRSRTDTSGCLPSAGVVDWPGWREGVRSSCLAGLHLRRDPRSGAGGVVASRPPDVGRHSIVATAPGCPLHSLSGRRWPRPSSSRGAVAVPRSRPGGTTVSPSGARSGYRVRIRAGVRDGSDPCLSPPAGLAAPLAWRWSPPSAAAPPLLWRGYLGQGAAGPYSAPL